MPRLSEVQRYFTGSWRLLNGRKDGLRLLDISADGFWDSFFAIVVALPPLALRWFLLASELARSPDIYGGTPSIILRIAISDAVEWIVPLVALAVLARQLGIADRFVAFVVANNWSTALLLWLTLPLPLIASTDGLNAETITLVVLAVFILTTVMFWRLTNATLDKGAGIATAVTIGIVVLTILLELVLSTLLGLYIAEVVPAA
ncbi:MAG: transporter [Rhizobiaceae bacterium]